MKIEEAIENFIEDGNIEKEVTYKITQTMRITEDAFIYEYILPYCSQTMQIEIDKSRLIEALEKQIPQKPNKDRYYIKCGNCGHNIPKVMKKGKMPYCPFCGQHIDWSEEE